jgi:hypothetical protein
LCEILDLIFERYDKAHSNALRAELKELLSNAALIKGLWQQHSPGDLLEVLHEEWLPNT